MLERHSVQVFLPLDISARSNGLKFSGITSATPLSTLGKNCKLQGEQCIKPVSNNYFENKSLVAISNSGVSTIGLNTEGYIKASSEENKFKKSKCSGLHHGLAETKVTSLNLFDLPPEILDLIFSFLDQKTLVNVLYVSQKGRNSAIPILYRRPYFTTTYRLAQFVTTVSSNMELLA